jgi:dihydrofolate synthase/folylpolyglutamate synthase
MRLGLDQIRAFLTAMGEPHRAVPMVHVAGTNGKGSVCTMTAAALTASGMRVGTYLSPHVEEINERIRLDGEPVSDGLLNEAIEAVARASSTYVDAMGTPSAGLTYFEFMTVVAFYVFSTQRVDVAVIEVGLGGRLDATNVVDPLVCAITSIGLDHQAQLGDDIAGIAREKAGIIKRGVPVVLGPMPTEAMDAIVEIARARGAEVWRPGVHLRRQRVDDRWSFSCPSGSVTSLQIALAGTHQVANATVAFGIVQRLRGMGFPVSEECIRVGFAAAHIEGRLEELRPGLVVDGAHNELGARALAGWLAKRPRPATRILLWGMGEGRDAAAVLAPLIEHFDEVVTTRCAHPKARDPYELAMSLQDIDCVLSAAGPIEEALPEVLAEADEVIAAGSLFLAGAVRSLVREMDADL